MSAIAMLLTLSVLAAPTVEERALAADLAGRPAEAVRLLEAEADGDPSLRHLAGMVALRAGRLPAARRLLGGDAPWATWGAVEIHGARGEVEEAAERALTAMDVALGTAHADALGSMLVDWASERAEKDPVNAMALIEAVLGFDVSDAVRRRAEDVAFGLRQNPSEVVAAAAWRRFREDEGELAPRMALGLHRAASDPAWSFHLLEPVVRSASQEHALRSARTLVTLDVPLLWRVGALDALLDRFPEDGEVASIRLEVARQAVASDPGSAQAAFAPILEHPVVGRDARAAYARSVMDPAARRVALLALAEREGRSASGQELAREALEALRQVVRNEPEGEARRRSAEAAAATPDGAADADISWWALPGEPLQNPSQAPGLPEDPLRLSALWDHLERFPGYAAACEEAALRLALAGADGEDAMRFRGTCPHAGGPVGQVIHALASDSTALVLLPTTGGVLAVVTGARELVASRRDVDPGALLRAADAHPLETRLDAFLVEPDSTWTMEVEPGTAQARLVEPGGRGPLAALTLRAGDQEATRLVVLNPVDVVAVTQGRGVAVGALRGDEPLGRAEVTVVDDLGVTREATTDRGGVAVIGGEDDSAVPSQRRVMVRRGDQLGFAEVVGGNHEVDPGLSLSLHVEDRSLAAEGRRGRVLLVSATPSGEGDTPCRVRSFSRDGTLLDEQDVEPEGGAAMVELFLQGGGRVEAEALADPDALASVAVPAPGPFRPESRDLRIRFSEVNPEPGASVEVHVAWVGALSSEGRRATLRYRAPGLEGEEEVLLGGDALVKRLDLSASRPGDLVHVAVHPHGAPKPVGVSTRVAARDPLPVEPPGLVLVGAPLALGSEDGAHLKASGPGRRVVWAAPGEPLALPAAGTWSVAPWLDGRTGASRQVLAVEPGGDVTPDGRWGSSPALATRISGSVVDARWLFQGDPLPLETLAGADRGWLAIARGTGGSPLWVPLQEPEVPAPVVSGRLRAGGRASIRFDGLPAGSLVWAFARDGSDLPRSFGSRSLQARWKGGRGYLSLPLLESPEMAQPIAAALLGEEERVAEVRDRKRLDYAFTAEAEEAETLGLLGTRGHGAGGVGYGGGASSTSSFGSTVLGAVGHVSPDVDGRVLGTLLGGSPGTWEVEVPSWVTAAFVHGLVRLPDGRWISFGSIAAVDGEPGRRPDPPVVDLPESWDGTSGPLEEVAARLPAAARVVALAALVEGGSAESRPSLLVARSLVARRGAEGALAAHLAPRDVAGPDAASLQALKGLPDRWRAARAEAALAAALHDPDRAAAVARRVLRDPEVEPWVRARAGLALHLAGCQDEARGALESDELEILLARALVEEQAPRALLPVFWGIARSDAAAPLDRAMAVAVLARSGGRPVVAAPAGPATHHAALEPILEPPLAELDGVVFTRGRASVRHDVDPAPLPPRTTLPAGRTTPLRVSLPPMPIPTRVRCPAGSGFRSEEEWISLAPSWTPVEATCTIQADLVTEGEHVLVVERYGPLGERLSSGSLRVQAAPWSPTSSADAMSADEQVAWAAAATGQGDGEAIRLLHQLLETSWLAPDAVRIASAALLAGAILEGEPRGLVRAFESYRERVPGGDVDLDTAAAVAHAYLAVGEPARALEAAFAVVDGRFKEELAAVNVLHSGGLTLTALKLLRDLVGRYPETTTVVDARYLAPSMLLARAGDASGDFMGYTRSSLQHSAVADLASFLLLHPSHPRASEGASILLDALESLREPERAVALAAPLARRYRQEPMAWRLILADARARFAAGRFAPALRALAGLREDEARHPEVELERGRALEALGRPDEAMESYQASGLPEARARLSWLSRSELDLPPFLALGPKDEAVLSTRLPAGTRAEVTLYRIALESLLLRDGGHLDVEGVRVDGLGSASRRTVTLGPDGNIPLGKVSEGAWLAVLGISGQTRRTVVVRTDSDLAVRGPGGGDTLVHLLDSKGRPVGGADVWTFDGSGFVAALKTDPLGAAWLPTGGGALGVLAKAGGRYAWWSPSGSDTLGGAWQAASPSRRGLLLERSGGRESQVVMDNAAAYGELFQQDRESRLQASSL